MAEQKIIKALPAEHNLRDYEESVDRKMLRGWAFELGG